MTSTAKDSITLRFEAEGEESDDDVYGALTNVKAQVFRAGTSKQIGTISGIRIDRQKIPERAFCQTFDEHSADLEWVAGSLLENRYGRTKLSSLRDAGDDPEFDFFFMETFHIDGDQPSEVATLALHNFLQSEHIKGNLDHGCWCVSSIAYVMSEDPKEEVQGSKRKRGNDDSNYHGVIPFLRNGFFQDSALIRSDPDNARILVGGLAHFEKDLLSEAEAMAKATRLLGGSSKKKVKGNDLDILNGVRDLVDRNFQQTLMQGVSSAMLGATPYRPPGDCTSEEQLQNLKRQILRLQSGGGSIARSGALHAACEKNSTKVVKLLLQMDPTSSTAKDQLDRTPLIMAAINATGRLSINGIDDTAVIDALLQAGARKADVDSSNMTAYGYFRQRSSQYLQITHYEHRHKITNLEHKLYPPGGPTVGDFAEGRGGSSGIVDYGPEDDEADREMGEGVYAEKESGDY
mmetsp:Transcript_4513/g.8040  ORF Transcript_4513/g.8040 Transcript_4513/m.8040 type:complete len:462 (+) Transcript_4513:103-1488(+)|eukprot:CAMPEP_0201920016 /NCGR_PEP_ID=MMETSP0903-20130614/8735_1 /ASSEMBLY_ACC=CAM_ASM_000552 /TAXON_ID=420261 /ORGANISM="Thalassiosira antarctica, Strain CCMP982" /LENGTH=461 /DNA_ID=CAMNT_0048456665 /DNA_START=34 /DNA_END=1419 /DNA_ORIENTATION=-